jgi:hypothetical protein
LTEPFINKLDQLEHEKKIEKQFNDPAWRAAISKKFGVTFNVDAKQDNLPIVACLVPSHRQPQSETVGAFERMVSHTRTRGIAHILARPSIASSVVHWIRNQLLASLHKDVADKKSPTPTHVLFMDDDMGPAPHALESLLSRKVDIVGGVCTVRQDPPMPNARHYDEKDRSFKTADIERPGFYKVGGIGTGLMLISMKALQDVAEYTARFEYQQKYLGMSKEKASELEKNFRERAEKTKDFWWFEFLKQPDGVGEFGEDIAFCFKAKECGYEIYGDATFETMHYGNYGYSLPDYWEYRPQVLAKNALVSLVPEPEAPVEYEVVD